MLARNAQRSLSHVLAVRMAAIASLLSLVLMALFTLYLQTDVQRLRRETLSSSALQIAQLLSQKENPSKVRLYHDYPQSYGFRVFDVRLAAKRHVLASMNASWLERSIDAAAVNPGSKSETIPWARDADLEEGFASFEPPRTRETVPERIYVLTDRVVVPGHKFWIQTFMRGDPAWTSAPIIFDELLERVLVPVLFIVPALTLAMFLSIRRALLPLLRLTETAKVIGNAVARGQSPVLIAESAFVREFADVASTINRILSELSRALHSQNQFITDAAHELRTPLAVLLLEAARLPPSATRDLIKNDLSNLGDLVNELLRFATAEAALVQMLETVDVAAIARKVSRDAAITAVGRDQLIELNCPVVPVTISGNPTLIEIAIRNLVENALKYSGPNTTVTVSVSDGPAVRVEDSGPGIPVSQRNTIFQRFWRMHPQAGTGAGVGLALVRRIAELHDGHVWLEDRPGGGSTFVLNFGPAVS